MSIVINTSIEYQEIDGFGGGANLIEQMSDDLADFLFTDAGIGLTFARGERCSTAEGILSNHTTVYANDEDNTDFIVPGADQINTPKMYARGVKMYFTNMWVPRAWTYAGVTGDIYSANYPALHPNYYQAWADTWKNFLDTMHANGMPVYGIGLQNEPNIPDFNWEWIFGVGYSPTEYYNYVQNYLKPAIAASSQPNCKLIPFDLSDKSPINPYIQEFFNNGMEGDFDTITAHIYNNALSDLTGFGKKVWNTETGLGTNPTYDPSIQDAIGNAKLIHNNLINNVSVYSQMSLWIPQWVHDAFTGMANLGILGLFDGDNTPIPKRAYIFGQYSRFVRPGFVRVECTGAPSGTYVTAYKNGTDVVAVAINENLASTRLSVGGFDAGYVDVWVTDESRSLEGIGSIELTDGGFNYSAPKESVVTFVKKAAPSFALLPSSPILGIQQLPINIKGQGGIIFPFNIKLN